MQFSPLETAAITGFVSLVVALTVHAVTRRNYVSHSQCDERRRAVCQSLEQFRDGQADLRRDIRDRTNTIFRMVRAMVAHDKDMPPDVKADILNETPGGGQ